MDPRNHVLDAGQDRMNALAAVRSDMTAMQSLANLLGTFVLPMVIHASECGSAECYLWCFYGILCRGVVRIALIPFEEYKLLPNMYLFFYWQHCA